MKRVLRWSAFVVVLLVITCITTGAVINWVATTGVNEGLDQIRRENAPIAMASVQPPDCNPDENAAAPLLGAFRDLDDALDEFRLDGSIPSTSLAAKIPDLVAKYGERLAAARIALQRPRCRFDIDYVKGVSALLPHILPVLRGAKLMKAEAFDRRAKNDVAGSIDSALDLLTLAVLLAEEPIFVTQLVRSGMAIDAMGLIEAQPMTAAQEERLIGLLDRAELRQGLARALQADRAMVIQVYGDLLAGHAAGSGVPDYLAWWPMRPLVRREFAGYLRAMNDLVALARRDYHECKNALETVERSIHGSRTAGMFVPAVSKVALTMTKAQARLDLARLAVAVRRGKELPTLTDPFSGRPYGRNGDLLWSAGESGRDDVTWRVR